MNVKTLITLARKHVADHKLNEGSARLCLADAVKLYDDGDLELARVRALKSLRYSLGVFSKVYQRAVEQS